MLQPVPSRGRMPKNCKTRKSLCLICLKFSGLMRVRLKNIRGIFCCKRRSTIKLLHFTQQLIAQINVFVYQCTSDGTQTWICSGTSVEDVNTLAPGWFQGFSEKKRLNARGFAREFLRSGMLYRPGKSLKRRGKSSSLHLKKYFLHGGVRVFCEWRHKWRTFRPPWPALIGPGRQPLGGSISLKFLLETRLQSESFDTLYDLLRFRVQKLWCKLVKILD